MVAGRRHVFIRRKEMRGSPLKPIAEPHLVFFYQRKNLFVCYGVLMTYYYELLAVLNQLGNVFTEQREWRIGNNDVCLAEQGDTFGRTEVARFER